MITEKTEYLFPKWEEEQYQKVWKAAVFKHLTDPNSTLKFPIPEEVIRGENRRILLFILDNLYSDDVDKGSIIVHKKDGGLDVENDIVTMEIGIHPRTRWDLGGWMPWSGHGYFEEGAKGNRLIKVNLSDLSRVGEEVVI